jgi:hypothetical protein
MCNYLSTYIISIESKTGGCEPSSSSCGKGEISGVKVKDDRHHLHLLEF